MKLTKEQALLLVKVLDRHDHMCDSNKAMGDLQHDLEQFVLRGDSKETADEEAEDDGKAEEACDGSLDETEGEGEGEEGEPEESDRSDLGEAQDESGEGGCDVYAADLIALKPFNVSKKGKKKALMRFLPAPGDTISLAVATEAVFPVGCVVRTLNELHVWGGAHNTWHAFRVTKFPKAWVDAFPLDLVAEVVT